MKFTIEITDKAQLAGIAAAREARNAGLTPVLDAEGKALPIEGNKDYIATDAAYVQFVMQSAAESYAKSYGLDGDMLAAQEKAVADKRARLDAMK